MAADPRRAAAWHPPARHQDNGRPDPSGARVIDMRPGGRHARDRTQARRALVIRGGHSPVSEWPGPGPRGYRGPGLAAPADPTANRPGDPAGDGANAAERVS